MRRATFVPWCPLGSIVEGVVTELDDAAAASDSILMSKLPFEAAPVSILLNRVQRAGYGTDNQVLALHKGFLRLTDEVPEGHRHWDGKAPFAPCVSCSLFMVDWYRDFIAVLTGSGKVQLAVDLGAIAAAVLPYSASAVGNYAVALRTLALATEESPERRRLFAMAAKHFRSADELETGSSMYGEQAAEIEKQL